MTKPSTSSARTVLLLGATGTAGAGTMCALIAAGHRVTVAVRTNNPPSDALPPSVTAVPADLADPASVANLLAADKPFDAIISCIASRTGAPADAWAVDHHMNSLVLAAAQRAGVRHFVLLSAICVQKPKLAFQHAKLAFEAELRASGLTWSIVRPTAFFKSLSGQVQRVRAGKPFLVFGNGTLTACKPISDDDLGRFLVSCLDDPAKHNVILPIGGPGPAITPLDQGRMLFEALGKEPKFKHVPVRLLDVIIGVLSLAGKFSTKAREKAELARIGRYYATESMLVWDKAAQRHDADATPEFGEETLNAHYEKLARGEAEAGLGAHRVF